MPGSVIFYVVVAAVIGAAFVAFWLIDKRRADLEEQDPERLDVDPDGPTDGTGEGHRPA